MDCDILLHFNWIHSSHIHKYLSLNKKLNEKCHSFLIIDNGPTGISEKQLMAFKKIDLINVKSMGMDDAILELKKSKYKVYVFGSSGITKGDRPWAELSKSKGALTVQLSDQIWDIYYKTPDVLSLISPLVKKLLPFEHKRIIYSNCFLWDNIDDCLPYFLSKKDFCDKYTLDVNEPIFLWTPDNIQAFKTEESRAIYDKVCGLKNVLVKLHPNEHNKIKQHFFGGKMSYEIFTKHKVKILDPVDTHFALKYLDCGIGYSSTVALEFPIYKKPYVYVGLNSKGNILLSRLQKDVYQGNYSWVGGQCNPDEIETYFYNKKYLIGDEKLYDSHLKKFLADSLRTSSEILVEQLTGFL